jgi:NADH:ubiquinone oxidoreductase subunit 2 (subunit N)
MLLTFLGNTFVSPALGFLPEVLILGSVLASLVIVVTKSQQWFVRALDLSLYINNILVVSYIFLFLMFFLLLFTLSYFKNFQNYVIWESLVLTFGTQCTKIFIIWFILITLQHFIQYLIGSLLEVWVLVVLAIYMCFICISSYNFIIIIAAVECISLISYLLVLANKTVGNILSSIKYFIFGSFGSVMLIWSAVLFLWLFNTFEIVGFTGVATMFNLSNIIVISFAIKMACAPFHQWVADVYAGAPVYIVFIFAVIIKLFLVFMFIKFMLIFQASFLLDILVILSLIVGAFYSVSQTELKRFIAYSSVTQLGVLLGGDIESLFLFLGGYLLSLTLLLMSILRLCVFLNIQYFYGLSFW